MASRSNDTPLWVPILLILLAICLVVVVKSCEENRCRAAGGDHLKTVNGYKSTTYLCLTKDGRVLDTWVHVDA